MIITHKIKMDLQDPGYMPRVNAVQDDQYSRNLELTLSSGGEAWTITEDVTVLVRYCKPDGTGGEYNTLPDGTTAWTAEGNVLTIALAPQVLTVPGMVTLSASLISGETQISTFTVSVNVKPAVCAQIADSADYVNVMTVGTVQMLKPGAAPTANITGTRENPVLNLGIPASEMQTTVYKEITIEAKAGGFWDIEGEWIDAETAFSKRTNLIPVRSGEGFLYTGTGSDYCPSVIWFDQVENVVSHEYYSVETGLRVVIAPENAAYARFYSYCYSDSADSVILELTYLPKGDDRFVEIESRENGYWNKNGTWTVAAGGAKRTNPILVTPDDRFHYFGFGHWSAVSVFWFDENGSIVSYGQYADEIHYIATKVTLIPPVGAVFARFYSYSDVDVDHVKLDVYIETDSDKMERYQQSNVLYGKKYVACGDSFTAGDFTNVENAADAWDDVRQTYKTYPWWIADRNGMWLENEAVCGSTMHNNGTGDAFSVSRYTAVPADADYITLSFGLNETSAELGTLEDTTNDTVIGAWNVVLEYLITNMPYAKIGIIIPDGWCTEEMRSALVSVAQYWGIPYLDLKGDASVPLMTGGRYSDATVSAKAVALRNAAFQISDTDAHPKVKAHEYRSTVIEHFLRSL